MRQMEVREPSELRLCGKKGARRYVIGASLKYLSYSCSLQLVVVLVCEMHGIVAESGSPHFPNRRSDTLQNEALRKTKHTNGDHLRVSGGQRPSTESVSAPTSCRPHRLP
jgi:hypothetical protein